MFTAVSVPPRTPWAVLTPRLRADYDIGVNFALTVRTEFPAFSVTVDRPPVITAATLASP